MSVFLKYREWVLAAIISLMVTGISVYAPAFGTLDNATGVLNDTAFLFMMALAQMVVILTRGIDLSVAANLALTGMLTGIFNEVFPDLPALVYVAVALTIGGGLGLINGSLIALLRIPPIVVTLGTLAIFRGMIVVIGGGSQVNTSDMSASFVFLAFPACSGLQQSWRCWLGFSCLRRVRDAGFMRLAAIRWLRAIAASACRFSKYWLTPFPARLQA